MNYTGIRRQVTTPLFFSYQLERLFPAEPKNHLNIQLSRWVKSGKLIRLRRGLFLFPETKVDELVVANAIYRPSYVSLESALNLYGLIPDVATNVTSITPTTTKMISTPLGIFFFSKIRLDLYFGFQTQQDALSGLPYLIATPEKALLDYVYIRKITDLDEHRVDISALDRKTLKNLSQWYPAWVQKVTHE